MMLNQTKYWIVILLLFMTACDSKQAEENSTRVNEVVVPTVENVIPTVSHFQPQRSIPTPTLRPTPPASDSNRAFVRPKYNAIYIRSGPGDGYSQIGLLYEDETASVLGIDDFDAWYEIVTGDGQEGWVAVSVVELHGQQIVHSTSPTPGPRITGEPGTPQLQVSINMAFVRSGPGQNYHVVDHVSGGSTMTIIAYTQNGAWFNVRLSNNRTGWIGATITEPVGDWSIGDIRIAATTPVPPPTPQNNCDPAYPTVCIPSSPPDLDCRDIEYRNFTALPPDPHLFDGNQDGVGCGT